MTPHNNSHNLAGMEHWDFVWKRVGVNRVNLRSYYDYRFARLFHTLITQGSKVLEVGCGGSVWLPYFARYLQCEVWGIDYSEPGVSLALSNLEAEGVSGTIVLGDVFNNHEVPPCFFDVVWSAGFIEHFNDIQWVVGKLAKYLKPGGMMITLVPNLDGFIGWLHRVVAPKVYQAHVKINPEMLDNLHTGVGLEVLSQAHYFGVFSIGVVNFNHFRARLPRLFDVIFWSTILVTQQSMCFPFRLLNFHPETILFSPWIIGVYHLPQSEDFS